MSTLISGNAPQVASVDKNLGKITVNDQEGGDITYEIGSNLNLAFYAWADANQMPIRWITVDWSGTSLNDMENTVEVISKNYKWFCDETSFADISDACTVGYLQYQRIINECKKNSSGWEADLEGEGPSCDKTCCFKPRVRIQDNWGWCTDGAMWCNGDLGGGWVSYGGIITVKP